MAEHLPDASVLAKIEHLVEEEQKLYGSTPLDDHAVQRLARLKVELDQCWDLLRQRRALREFGEDPNRASVRPAAVVENYEEQPTTDRFTRASSSTGQAKAFSGAGEEAADLGGKASGDSQGLSTAASASEESVTDLVAEGQDVEAGAVDGVEDAGDHPERPVRSHEDPHFRS